MLVNPFGMVSVVVLLDRLSRIGFVTVFYELFIADSSALVPESRSALFIKPLAVLAAVCCHIIRW